MARGDKLNGSSAIGSRISTRFRTYFPFYLVTDLRSWVTKWNQASLRQIAALRQPPPSRRWPLAGMLAIGLVVGAIGTYAITQRSQIRVLARRALAARRQVPDDSGAVEVAKPVSVTSRGPNHRREAAVEIT